MLVFFTWAGGGSNGRACFTVTCYSNLLLNSIAARAHSHIDSKKSFSVPSLAAGRSEVLLSLSVMPMST